MQPLLPKEEQIEKTLASIDQVSRADAPPFFYTRLQAQLDKKAEPTGAFWMMGKRPVLSLATLSVLLVLNIGVVYSYLYSKTGTVTQESTTGIQAFADTYNLGGTSVFTDKTADQ